MVSQLCLICLGARPRYNLVVDGDVKKPNKQTMMRMMMMVMMMMMMIIIIILQSKSISPTLSPPILEVPSRHRGEP